MCRNDPYQFRAAFCEDCESTTDLYINRFRDNVKCISCINKILEAAKVETVQIDVIEVEIEE